MEYFIGVDIGGTKIQSAIVDKQGVVHEQFKERIEKTKGAQTSIKQIISSCTTLLKEAEETGKEIKGIGMGMPGVIDQETGFLYEAPNLPDLNGKNIRGIVEKEIKLPIFLDNDVNLGTLGEFVLGSGKGYKHGMGIFVGTGIGGGIFVDGKLYTGTSGGAGEVGHITIDYNSKIVCSCGRKGCFEALASRSAIAQKIVSKSKANQRSPYKTWTKNYKEPIRSKMILKAYTKGDKVTKKVLEKESKYLGIGVGSVINILNPDIVILGGGLMEKVGPLIIDDVRKYTKSYALDNLYKNTKIELAGHGDFSVVVGGAVLVMEKLGQEIPA